MWIGGDDPAPEVKPPMKMLFNTEQLREQIENDPDVDVEAGHMPRTEEIRTMIKQSKFKVGDRVLPLNSLYRHYPVATVTEITERGFKYRHDAPINLGARIGWYQEGEALDVDHWELAASTFAETSPTSDS
jgi:hypothetical protein